MAPLKTGFLLLAFLIPILSSAQKNIEQLSPEQYYDFWVGSWDVSWKSADGTVQKGTNHIEKILDGMVILENFEAKTGKLRGYKGKSMSVYEKKSATWRQTWVDNKSGYIDLIGKIDGNKRIFITETTGPDGKQMLKRMVFHDITPTSFTWDWEASTDHGQTWTLRWRIQYKRHNVSSR